MMKKKSTRKTSWKVGVGLFLGSLFLLLGLFFPWLSLNFAWSFPRGSEGRIDYDVNGLGWGTASVNISFTNRSCNYSVFRYEKFFLPSLLPLGSVIGGIATMNLGFSLFFLGKLTNLLPKSFQKWIRKHSLLLLVVNSASLLVPLLLFSLNYFHYSISSALFQIRKPGLGASPVFFSESSPSLFTFYKSFFNYFTWVKKTHQYAFASSIQRNFMPGVGFLLVWVGELFIMYAWFIRVMLSEKWPKVWQKRGVFLPFMISLTFLPSNLRITPHTASLSPLLFSNVLFGLGGAIYFLLTCLLLLLIRQVALTEKTISQRITQLLTKTAISNEEVENITTTLYQKKQRAKYYRIMVGILHVVLLLFVWLLFFLFLTSYIEFNVLEEKMRIMQHTFWNWPLFFTPVLSLLLNLLFFHGSQ